MLQTLKSVSGLGKNKSQNALSLDGQLVTDQILIANNLNEIFTSIGQTKANNIPLSINHPSANHLPTYNLTPIGNGRN